MSWGRRFSGLITLNWREKLMAVVLAFLFWLLIKAQIARPPMPAWQQMPMPVTPPPVRLTPDLPPAVNTVLPVAPFTDEQKLLQTGELPGTVR
jgi:hypothetical protein